MVKDKTMSEDSIELGVSKSVECDTFSLHCCDTVGWATGMASTL